MTTDAKKPLLKPAVTSVPVLDVIRDRWSPRAFDVSRPIEREILLSLLEAARWAASSRNTQPWRFIVATRDNEAEYQTMFDVIMEGNQEWAKHAPLLMIAVAEVTMENGNTNGHATHDTGMALAHLTLQATAHGLGVHMMGGFHKDKATEVYNIPEGYQPITALAIGYPGDPEILSERRRTQELNMERVRKPLSEIVFSGDWQQSAGFLE